MKILLTALNAKYIHTNLAVRYLAAYCKHTPHDLVINEYTINDHEHTILSGLFKETPDVVCFSCYIWNRTLTLSLVDSLKKILPGVIIVLGGPEVTDNEVEIITNHPVDIVVTGEGEEPFRLLLDYFAEEIDDLTQIPRITINKSFRHPVLDTGSHSCLVYQKEVGLRVKPAMTGEATPLDSLPFPYQDLAQLNHKIIYYETSRGCPFSCVYCLSGKDNHPRFLSLTRCYAELQFFLDNKVNQVKFIDRTFNCNKPHAMAIWGYLIKHDNNHTNFHFEIAADLLDDEMLELLKTARPGLFQFEIGIQSTHMPTLKAIHRKTNLHSCFENIKKILKMGNIHTHVDLIAGLPHEGINNFKKSFNDVYSLQAEHLQLGFLKLLHGSTLRHTAHDYGIVYKNAPPYEVLSTKDLQHQQIIRLKAIEEMLKIYFNSGRYQATLAHMISLFASPFDFYDQLAHYFEEKGYAQMGHTKWKQYDILHEFLTHNKTTDPALIRDLLLFDMYKTEQVPNLPPWANLFPSDDELSTIKQALQRIPGNEQGKLKRRLHVQKFAYDIASFAQGNAGRPILCDSFILFDYTKGRETIISHLPHP